MHVQLKHLRLRGQGQHGLTMVELLISLVIGLVVIGAVSYVYIGSRGAYRGNEGLARVQEAGRFALDAIARDVRRAGALGCGSSTSVGSGGAVAVNILSPAALGANLVPITGFAPAIYSSFPATGWTAPAGAPTYWGGDVLQLQISSGTPVRVVANPDPVAATIPIADNTGNTFKNGDLVLLGNCSSATVFQIAATPAATAPSALQWWATGGAVPALNQSGTPNFNFDSHATVLQFDQVTYYIGIVPNSTVPNTSRPQTALYRYSLRKGSAEELVENVEDLDIVYGVGNAGSMSAGQFKHWGLMTAADWPNVLSVRVSVLAVGDQTGAAASRQQILLRTDPTVANATTLVATNAPDTRLRQVYTTTAAVRDRLP